MEPENVQQEILLNTDTCFAHRQWTDSDSTESEKNLNPIEQLEKACWDGLVKELIPELDITLHTEKKLWLWQVHETRSFLALNFYEYPGPLENESSIDPYLFMGKWKKN
jgi:hypothetical protein